MDVSCEDRHPYRCRNFGTEGGCSWGSDCEYLHDVTSAWKETESIEGHDNLGDLEFGGGEFGFDILERDAATISVQANSVTISDSDIRMAEEESQEESSGNKD